MQKPDFNSPAFTSQIRWFGPGRNPFTPTFTVKRRFDPNAPKGGGTFSIWPDKQGITVTWVKVGWNESIPERRFGMLVVIAWVPRLGRWCAWNIEHLRHPVETTGTSSVNTTGWPNARDWVDVIAQKTNSPDSQFRFADKDWFGILFIAHPDGEPTQSNARSDILAVRYAKTIFDDTTTSPDKGVEWNNSIAKYPQFVMGPSVGFMNGFNVAAFVKEQITETGFHGIHIPLAGGWDDKVFRFLELAAEKKFLIHFWIYGDRQAGTAPSDPNSDSARVWQDRLATKLRPYMNWSMGLGYDLHEWAPNDSDVGDFVNFWRVGLNMKREFGGRYLPEDRGPYPGQFISVQQQVINKDAIKIQLSNILDDTRPVITSDRFRVRPGTRPKDWELDQIPDGLRDCLDKGVAAIWGYGDRVSDKGSRPWLNKMELQKVLGGKDTPAPPLVRPAPNPLPNEWGLMAVLDQDAKINSVKTHTPSFNYIRSQITYSSLFRQGYNTPEKAAEQGFRYWYSKPEQRGYEIIVGTYNGREDLKINTPQDWQKYVLLLAEKIRNSGKNVWFVADSETAEPGKFVGSVQEYLDLWGGEFNLVGQLQEMGHLVMGPGMVHGNTVDFDYILGKIKFDAPSAHFYSDRSQREHEAWLAAAEDIARRHGYSWGVAGETGAHGLKSGFACRWNGDEQQIKRARSLKEDFRKRPFWTLKLWYQVYDTPEEVRKGKVGYGLYKSDDNPKPVSRLFK